MRKVAMVAFLILPLFLSACVAASAAAGGAAGGYVGSNYQVTKKSSN